jgi:prepilin signal peptidase PulO-like enzyme (type II secretory pathway)
MFTNSLIAHLITSSVTCAIVVYVPFFLNYGWFGFMVLSATFNNASVISWKSVLLVEYPEKTTGLLQLESLTNFIT